MGLNGDLYFSHAVEKDSRRDYCCFAAFPRIRTIVQKTAMSVIVRTSRCHFSFFVFSRVLFSSETSMMQTLICFQSNDHFQHVSNIDIHIQTVATLQKPSQCHTVLFCASSWFYVVILITVMIVVMHPCCPHVHFIFVSSNSISEKSDMSPEAGKFSE